MRFDQHFLINEKLAEEIVSYLKIIPGESILEIGPGKGILTKFLPKAILIEIDFKLANELRKGFPKNKVMNRNVLEEKLDYDKIIGNIPYSICEPLINKLLKSKFRLAVLTVPEKFLEKGLLKLIIPRLIEIKTLKIIDKDEFSPKPKVNSKVISIKKKKLDKEESLIKRIYQSSNKKLKNIINTDLSFKEKRVRELSLNEWETLLNGIKRTSINE
jgi:16S rRNA (adenine1518-N6/adenine1519-N6)-dimethyltransferase